MKKYLLLLSICLLFLTCKKSKVTPTPVLLDVVGTWTLYSWQQGSTDATVAQYPCLSENVLKINADYTTNTSYTGKDTCFIVRPTGPMSPWSAIGVSGQSPILNTWHRNGNDIYIGAEHYVISNTNNKLFLTVTDTITAGFTSPLIVKIVDVKE